MIRKQTWFFFLAALVTVVAVPVIHADPATLPDITGEWVNLDGQAKPTGAILTLVQNGHDISGKFTDRRDGKVLVDADLIGYVETDGAVVFDIYFGRVTSTNRLQLSAGGNMLTGSYTNTIGGRGDVTLRRNQQE